MLNRRSGKLGWLLPLLAATLTLGHFRTQDLFALAPASPGISRNEAAGLVRLEIEPDRAHIFGIGSVRQLLVTGHYADGTVRDFTREARWSADRQEIAIIDRQGVATARQPGLSIVTATVGRLTAKARILVSAYGSSDTVHFVRDVMPVLTLKGCNGGNCHGSMHGKNGFKLSQFGYDPDQDYRMMVRDAGGRRVNRQQPARSLILLKPTSTIPHGGGTRFSPKSHEFQVLAEWIASGAPGPAAQSKVAIERLEVIPGDRVIYGAEQEQQLAVLAHYNDGTVRDVTAKVKYVPKDEGIATVSEAGLVKSHRAGETSILVRGTGAVGVVRIAVVTNPPVQNYPSVAAHNFIDELVLAKLKRLRIVPSSLSSDEVFLRRAFLDSIGTLPTATEARAFLADRDPRKRERLVDRLLARPEYADYWGMIWAELLTVTAFKAGASRTVYLDQWIRDQLRENVPFDRFAREILAGTGSTRQKPGIALAVSRPPEQAASFFSQLFLGVRIQCAQCHDHPFENWKQTDYFQMVAFFSQVSTRNGKTGTIVYDDGSKALPMHPVVKKAVAPRFLGGGAAAAAAGEALRRQLADWMTAPDNPYFARAIANRIWAHYMGQGLVEPVDDFRETNPPSNPELLNALAREFVAGGYDLKRLMRSILLSRTYQLSAVTNDTNRDDRQHYSHYQMRRIYAEPLLDAITQLTEAPHNFRFGYPGMKAVELHDSVIPDAFLQTFDRNRREITCERDENITLLQTMELISGEAINAKIRHSGGTLDRLLQQGLTDDRIIEEMFLSAVSRYPEAEERRVALEAIRSSPSRRRGLEDVLWALVNSREFLFNH